MDASWNRLSLVLATISVGCLLTITGILLRREFVDSSGYEPPPPRSASVTEQPPVAVKNWSEVAGTGHRMGPGDAPVTIVVFSDFQCPFCTRFAAQTLPALERRFPGKIATVYRHWPLQGHPLAYPAARAAECASDQGRFEAFYSTLYAHRDSLGIIPFRQLAKEAGVKDLGAFDQCNARAGPVPVIQSDVAEAKLIGGRGTPTLVINGMLMRARYDSVTLGTEIQAALNRVKQ